MRIISICGLSTTALSAFFLRNDATKTLAIAIELEQNTKGNENDSHYRPSSNGL
jgi:hypothetical protein